MPSGLSHTKAGDWLVSARQLLTKAGIEAPYESALIILEHASGMSRSGLLAHPEQEFEPSVWNNVGELLSRRLKHEPVAYLTGSKEFYGREFKVSSAVLIPRPETEELVDLARSVLPTRGRLVDGGTGSGCLAITLKQVLPEWCVTGVDISSSALTVARVNDSARNVSWLQGSWLSAFATNSLDAVISNPPYVTTDEYNNLDPQVHDHEPRLALEAGRDGLKYYSELIVEAVRCLKDGCLIAMEGSYSVLESVATLLADANFRSIEVKNDLTGRSRFVTARK